MFYGDRLCVIAGPCSAESREQVLETAKEVASAGVKVFRAGLWKPRTHSGCFEGVGYAGLEWLKQAREEYGLKVCTEVAGAAHVEACLEAGLDLLWIGARTTASPFLVQEIADALKGSEIPILVKNPMAEDFDLWIGALERLNAANVTKLGAVLRGFPSFYRSAYRNEPHWESLVKLRSLFPQLPVFCDPSHISGNSSLVPELSQRAAALGVDGLMIECHCHPQTALSDSGQQLTVTQLKDLLASLKLINRKDGSFDGTVCELRTRIDVIDEAIVRELAERMDICREIARIKREQGIAAVQPGRWNKVLEAVQERAEALGLDRSCVRDVFNTIHETSVKEQNKILQYAQNQDPC